MAEPSKVQTKIVVPGAHSMVSLLGSRDELLHAIERAFGSDIHVRGNEITITGEAAENELAAKLFEELITLLERGDVLSVDAVERSLAMLRAQTAERPADVLTHNILSSRGRTIRPKTLNQKRYVDAIDKHTVVFGIGPAGTGKTYLAMAKAVQALQGKQVNRIILTRPAVEAGERLGFLPGTLYEKIDPYLRPLHDALHDMVDPDSIPRLIAAGTIEVAPLAYMRGRAQPVDTPVLTPDGFRPIGSLRVGDLVVGSDGRPTPVLGVYPQGAKPVFRLRTRDGATTLACAEHLWAVRPADDGAPRGSWQVLPTAELAEGLAAGRGYELPVVAPVEFAPRPVPGDAYALGRSLAETARRAPLALAAAGSAHRLGAARAGSAGGDVEDGGVPPEYLLNSVAVRLAVVQGLLDAAGDVAGGVLRCQAGSPRLRDDLVFLVRSLGGLAQVRPQPAAGRGERELVELALPAGLPPFRLAGNLPGQTAAGNGSPARRLESIEPAGTDSCVCIAVGAADSLYVTSDFLVTHNTLNDAFIILDEAQNTSPEQMKMFLTRLGFDAKMVITGDVTQVDLPTGTRSGLRVVQEILEGINDVHFCRLTSHDVVRHRLVSDIVDAYARYDEQQEPPSRPAARRRK